MEREVGIPSNHVLRTDELKKLNDYPELELPEELNDVDYFRRMKVAHGAGERMVGCISGSWLRKRDVSAEQVDRLSQSDKLLSQRQMLFTAQHDGSRRMDSCYKKIKEGEFCFNVVEGKRSCSTIPDG